MTASRMPQIPLDQLSPEQRQIYDRIASGPRGQIGAPHWAWLRSPALAQKAQDFGRFCRFETSLDPRLIEIAILATAAYWKAALEWDLHAGEAAKLGVPADTIEAIRREADPAFADAADEAVYRFTRELLCERRSAPQTYEALLQHLGEQEAAELVGVLGYYALISMTIVAFDVPSHLREDDSFGDRRAS